jgi:anti-sigma-K factor RskA
MNYRDPQLQSRLAAEYVSGAMRGGARRRFESLMAADATLRREVRKWEDDIYPLAWSLPPKTPPRRVWRTIRARLHGAVPAMSWGWNGIYLWRLLAGGFATVVIAGITLYPMQVDRAAQAQLLAILQTPQDRAALVVRAGPDGVLHARTLADLAGVAGDKSMELWVIPPGQKPQSLGLVAATGSTAIPLVRPRGLSDIDQLAITLEPHGGSPSGLPTGPVVMSGKLFMI